MCIRDSGNRVLDRRLRRYPLDRLDHDLLRLLISGHLRLLDDLVDVPLYHYKDKDFDIPLSLTYASNGWCPNRLQGSSMISGVS